MIDLKPLKYNISRYLYKMTNSEISISYESSDA